ncbi:N-acetylmuramoyl-L-alanine amidase family protein [Clostridium lacusfryxellense]|uniref:N-acetylmuramoyl-L-alanine amidase family protein n=1 Tax=Clostridium lacusfryxellense TaxID=205328 RepID=UPI001C0AF316|nr:N-acetylmuramoyl-L-alanine amidase [Clostridium lacusfryxellense]MBU3114849.1 N-acetylmuramoyl-L-alanine amidase [Clostridium lacusfryxellense]
MIRNKNKFLHAILATLIIFTFYNLTEFKDLLAQQKSDNDLVSLKTTISYPESPKKILVLDAGHGGYDPGSIGSKGIMEKDITLAIALKVGVILKENNIDVVYTRKSDDVAWPANVKQDLAARADISNNRDADLFISIHLNSFKQENVKGTETFYSNESLKGKEVAQLIHNQILKDVGFVDRGLRGETFSIFRNVKATTVLLELGYISNKNDEMLLNNSYYQEKLAKAIAEGALNYIDP